MKYHVHRRTSRLFIPMKFGYETAIKSDSAHTTQKAAAGVLISAHANA